LVAPKVALIVWRLDALAVLLVAVPRRIRLRERLALKLGQVVDDTRGVAGASVSSESCRQSHREEEDTTLHR
jgi:hypothetical protein